MSRSRSQPLVLVAAIAIAVAGLYALGRGNGGAERLDDAVARTSPGGSPLDRVLTARQITQFERATSNLSLVMYADALPAKRGKHLVREACADLDQSVELLRALASTCLPTLRLADAARAMRKACPGGVDCAAALRRRAATMRALAAADRGYARVVQREVPRGECREALSPLEDVINAELGVARADSRMAEAIADHDRPAFEEARRTGRRHAKVIDDDQVWYRTRDMAEACNLQPWAFETAS